MESKRFITIVPALPPRVNGLGDYACLLARDLRKEYQWDTVFFCTDTFCAQEAEGFKVEIIAEQNADVLTAAFEKHSPGIIIVHYVGYAYSSTGCPFWLLRSLQSWKETRPACKIICIFHEMYASGKPWQKAFWTHSLQKKIAFAMVDLADVAVTNTEVTFSIIRKRADKKAVFLPVFSNIGELSIVPPFHERENVLVIFGSAPLRAKVTEKSSDELQQWLELLKPDRIMEIGPPARQTKTSLHGTPVVNTCILSGKAISEILSKSRFGMIRYPSSLLCKSGVFAAYASHGVIPVVLGKPGEDQSGNRLKPGVHYLADFKTSGNFETLSRNISAWYREHDLASTARIMNEIAGEGSR